MRNSVDEFTKQAIWESEDKKCFYCGEILCYKNIHLDHVIPKWAFRKEEKSLRIKYALHDSFNFNSLENLVSTCLSCNSKLKREKILENGIPLWLDKIEKKKESIMNRASELKKELALDLPDEYKEFFLSSPSFMVYNVPLNGIRKKDIPMLKEMVFNENCLPFELVGDDGNVFVNTLKLYEKYSQKGYYALTSSEIGLSTLCDSCLVLFKMLEKAFPVKKKIKFNDYIRELPIDVLFGTCFENQHEELNKYNSIGNFIDLYFIEGTIKKINISENKLDVIFDFEDSHHGIYYEIREIMQADFNEKGLNELILFVFYHSDGTLHFTYPILASYNNNIWIVSTLG